jgi:ActR/RegA family two-component response regulator
MGPGNQGRPRVKKKILCLETEEILQNVICRAMESRFGYDVTRISSLAEAQEKLAAPTFDLLTMNLAIPVEDPMKHPHGFAGLTLLRELREGRYGEEAAKVRGLVMSGAANLPDLIAETLSVREKTWSLQKPMSYTHLKEALEIALGQVPNPGT